MKYTKRLTLYRVNPSDNTFAVQGGNVLTTLTGAMQIPSGPESARPSSPVNGEVRYNSTTQDTELYNISGSGTGWEKIKTNRQTVITPQNLGTGNYSNTLFGPLAYNVATNAPQNVLVFVDNVFQVPNTNYTLVTGTGTNSTASIVISTPPTTTTIKISTLTNILVGMTIATQTGISNGTTVTNVNSLTNFITINPATFAPIGAGTVLTFSESAGVYINFTSAVPAKPVFALLGFDGYTGSNN